MPPFLSLFAKKEIVHKLEKAFIFPCAISGLENNGDLKEIFATVFLKVAS